MITDLRDLAGATVFDADICILGAGAAGISIAMEFVNSSKRVLLLDGGGLTFEADTQSLYEVENVGMARQPMISSRLRMFGGTTNHWGGRCSPLDPIDFKERSWIPYSGWPIERTELDPYYERVHAICDLGPAVSANSLRERLNIPDPMLDETKLQLHHWMLSPPTRFGSKYLSDLKAAENITVVLHANVTNLQTNAAGTHLEHAEASTLEGKRARFRAKRFVVCCGGIENARLLLVSNSVESHGIGNRNGLVGRFFQEHLRSWQSALPTITPFALKKVYNTYSAGGSNFLVGLRLTEGIQEAKRIANCAAMTFFEGGEFSAGDAAMRVVRNALGQQSDPHLGDDIWSALSDLDEIIMSVRARYLLGGTRWYSEDSTTLVIETEQCPNPDSRISLSTERDALGLAKSKIDWRLTDMDREGTAMMMKLLAAQWGKSNQARVRMPDWLVDGQNDWAKNFKDVGHHMGTTRMANTPERGVVDRNCKVHEVDNLFMGGTSIFATSGHANPTMTIVALALRLADHLKGLSA
jgi:choline dehydrogenase-like flavoprotein